MSVIIDMEYFQSWSEIFMEIERQKNLRFFTAIEPDTTSEIKPSSKQGSRQTRKPKPGEVGCNSGIVQLRARLSSTPCPKISNNTVHSIQGELIKHKLREVQSRLRTNSTPIPVIEAALDELHQDSRLTDAARKLSREEMALLYEDILKPLDMFSILRKMRKQNDGRD